MLNYRLFFRKQFFFEYLYFSEYDIRMLFFFFSFRKRPTIKYVRNWGNGGGWGVMCKVYRCVQGKAVEKSVLRYVRTKWIAPNKFIVEYFLCIGSAKYTRASPPARKMPLFSPIIITIILSYAIIRI